MSESQPRALPIALAAAALSLALVAALAAAGWPGEPSACRREMGTFCFCERLRDGWVAQPANTLSNFGFVASGIAIAASADRPRRRRRNVFSRDPRFAIVYAVVTVLLGPGSMLMHASQTAWGGLVDVSSMYLFASLIVAYAAVRVWRLSVPVFVALFSSGFTGLVAAQATVGLPVNHVFGFLLVLALALEILHDRRRAAGSSIERGFAVGAVLAFLAAFSVWLPSLTGGPLCEPDSWLQGHAAWHLLCALATGLLYLYYASEDESDAEAVT